MTDVTNVYQLILALVFLGGQAFLWYDNRKRMDAAAAKTEAVKTEIGHLGVAVNGRTAELVQQAHQLGYAKGLADGIKAERQVAVGLVADQQAAAVTALAVTTAAAERHEGEGAGHP